MATEEKSRQPSNLFLRGGKTFEYKSTEECFSDWFGDSKVIDERGVPKRVYSGVALEEDMDISSFRGTRTPNILYVGPVGHFHGSGSFFSESPEVASSFPAMNKQGLTRRVYPAFLRIVNPKRYTTATFALKDYNDNFGRDVHRYVLTLKEQGYDGLMFKEGPSWAGKRKALQAMTWVVFEPEQVRFSMLQKSEIAWA